MITFTVITCTYNAHEVVKRTLDSVLSQTYPVVEHLIIDGASTDGTVAVVQSYQERSRKRDGRFRVRMVSEKDRGLYFAMNKGLEMAENDYVVFLNAGDTFASSDTLELVAGNVGEAEPLPGVLYGDTDIVDRDGHFLRHRRLTPPEHLTWRSFKWGMCVCHQSFYALTKIAKVIPYHTDYVYSADVDWCIRVMKACEEHGLNLRNVHGVVTHYLEGGMSIQNHKASLKERFSVMRHYYGLPVTLWMHVCFVFRSVFKP